MKQRAYLAVIFAATVAGCGGLFIKYMQISAPAIGWIRMAIPSVLLIAYLKYQGIPFFRGNYKKMMGTSVLQAIRLYLFVLAFVYTSIGNAIILFYSWPIFVAILGKFTLRERLSNEQKLLLLSAFGGLILAYSDKQFSFEDRDFIGMMAALLAAIIYSITVIIFKSESENYTRAELVFYQNIAGAFLFLPFFLYEAPQVTPQDWGAGTAYAILVGIVVYTFFFYGLRYLKASIASGLMYIEVVSAIILGYLWLGESLSWNMLIGGGLILLSSFLLGNRS
ncbi:MAG: DMT family transporter [Bacteroidota bacterium]